MDVSIINDDGETLQLKDIEESEDKEDFNSSVDDFERPPVGDVSKSDDEYVPEEEEEFDDEDEDEDEGFEEFMEEEFNGKEDFEEGADL